MMHAARTSFFCTAMWRFSQHFEFWFAAAALSAAWLYYPYCQTGPALCIWKKLFGVACPGCGLTRGVCFLVHGRWADAARFNPLSLLAGGILLGNIVSEAWRVVRERVVQPIELEGTLNVLPSSYGTDIAKQ